MHESSFRNMEQFTKKYLEKFKDKSIKILDIGSQDVNGSYKPIFQNTNWEYYGCDMVEGKNVDIMLNDIYDWRNIKSESFDVVISGQAFEHIEFFWITMLEISRILKDDGICCIIAPSSGNEHRYPLDCWRFYPDGFAALSKYTGLNVLQIYTEWDKENYPDCDPAWRDSVLICKKPKMRVRRKIKFWVKNKLSKFIVKLE